MSEHVYPECEKLGASIRERNAIVEFLDWAANEKGARLCNTPIGVNWHPVFENAQTLAHEFLEIDETKLEAERRTMIERARAEAQVSRDALAKARACS